MEITAGHGVAHGVNGAHVGLAWENGVGRNGCWSHPLNGLRQPRFARYQTHEPEGALRLILAWARPLCARSHAVQFATTGTR
jgi:hypothetical protein